MDGMKKAIPAGLGMYVTPATALRHVAAMKEEILAEARLRAARGEHLEATGGFEVWRDRQDERLTVLDVFEAHLKSLSPASVLAKPEVSK